MGGHEEPPRKHSFGGAGSQTFRTHAKARAAVERTPLFQKETVSGPCMIFPQWWPQRPLYGEESPLPLCSRPNPHCLIRTDSCFKELALRKTNRKARPIPRL